MPQALLVILLLSLSVFAQNGKVVGVTDGDTITVLTSNKKQIKVRLAGIDAPEKGQDYSDAAKKYLSTLIFNQFVSLEGAKIDRYRRTVAKVIHDGRDINYLMIENGLAWHFTKYASEQSREDRVAYYNAEVRARRWELNLWRYPNPVAPWDFRAGKSQQPLEAASVTRREPIAPLVYAPVYQSSSGGQIIGNKNSMIYHFPSCPSYDKVAPNNRVYFRTAQEAERAGYRVAKNC